ncbi:MAG: bifunctional metallophosphatase/5'-nucleotidase [Gammaproteobacteria bacterium]|nr:bifunctional metallophosphatase/5'-nucleotidase [Gammaproteobacteria bacterium]
MKQLTAALTLTLARTLALTACLAACTTPLQQAPDRVTLIVVNDTYRTDNFATLRSLRTELEKSEGDVLVLHAGDFLFPSLLSQRYDGKQMIDVMNLLDGDADAHDPHLFVTFGNHEFEKDKLKHAPLLQSRITESQFDWLGSNIIFKNDSAGQKLIQGRNLVESRIVTVNGIKVGLLGATTDLKGADYIDRFLPPAETVGRITRDLRAQGARLVIAVTHQTLADDKAMLESLGENAPDFVAGGHEHERKHEIINGRHLVKADADAASAAVVRISFQQGLQQNRPQTQVEYVSLPGDRAASPAMRHRTSQWNQRFAREYCADLQAPPDCMQEVRGRTNVELVAEELTIRRFETNLGNLLADTARATYAAEGAQIAFLNSGGMRLNYNIPPGDITRLHIDTLFAFPTRLALIRITGKQLQEIATHAITDWTGNGRWLQISGFAFKHNPDKGTAEKLSLITPQGLRPVRADDVLLAVTNDYLLNRQGDQDGYHMLGDEMVVNPARTRPDLKDELNRRLQRDLKTGIAPVVEGRICNVQQTADCTLFR